MDYFPELTDMRALGAQLVQIADLARKNGLLSLEGFVLNDHDTAVGGTFQKGIQLVVDGTDPELVRKILECRQSHTLFIVDYRWEVLRDAWIKLSRRELDANQIENHLAKTLFPDHAENSAIIESLPALLEEMRMHSGRHPLILAAIHCGDDETCLQMQFGRYRSLLARGIEVVIEGVLSLQSGDNPRIVADKVEAYTGVHIEPPPISTDDRPPSLLEEEIDSLLGFADIGPTETMFDKALKATGSAEIARIHKRVGTEFMRNALLGAARSTTLHVLKALDAQAGARLLKGLSEAPILTRDSIAFHQNEIISQARELVKE